MDIISKIIFDFDAWLDSHGVNEWNLRTVAVTCAVIFLGIRAQLGKKYKVDWDALVHAFITSVGSVMAVYLALSGAAEEVRGVKEPLGSLLCLGPVTNIHRLTPAITQGYAICDIINGFKMSKEALAHGLATFTVATLFNEMGASHLFTYILIMEVSTTILATLKATFFSPTMQLVTQASFVISFFVSRILLSTYFMFAALHGMYSNPTSLEKCFSPYLFHVTLVFSVFFTMLNCWWFVRMIAKAQRKLSGKEKMSDFERK